MKKRYAATIAALSAFVALAASSQVEAQTNDQVIATNRQGELRVTDDRVGFGEPRQWAFSTDAGLSISRTTLSGQDGATTTLVIQPALDYFVIKNLSVGGALGLTYQKTGNDKGTIFTLGPRVGYNFELSPLLSIWPKLGFSYQHTNFDSANDSANSLALNIFAPVMLHPAPHFFAGFGPFLDAGLSGDSRATTWGFKLTLGGWIQQKA